MARRQVQIFINGKQVENSIRGITSEKRKLNAELRRMTVGSKEYEKTARELRRVNGILDEHRGKIRNIDSAWSKLTKGGITKLGGLVAGAFAVDTIVQYGRELFNVSTQMELLQRKAETVFGQTLPQVTKAAEENAAAMGLTNSEYINAAASIADLLIPMKFQREEAADMSTALVDLSGALSEWTGGQITAEEVTRTLGKAILGEREELKQLGISINEADVQARLAEKGLKNLTGQTLQQAKATATLELITEKSLDAQTAFAENADLSARKQAELTARLQDVTEKLATALIPVFDRMVNVAEGAVNIIDSVADALVKLSDPAQTAVDAFDDQSAAVRTLESDLTPLLQRYDELTGKSELTAEEQDELKTVIQQIGEVTPTAITQIDEYGNALSINADKSREFLAAEKARLQFVNQEAISALEEQIQLLETQARIQRDLAESGETGGIISVQLDPDEIRDAANEYANLNQQIAGAQAQLARLTGQDLGGGEPSTGPSLSPTAEERAAQAAAAENLRKQQEEQAKRALSDRKRQLEQLGQALEEFDQEQSLARLSEDEQALERIRRRYQEQIDLALELEQQGVEGVTETRKQLEELRDQELLLLRLEQTQANFDAEMQLREEQEQERLLREQEFQTNRAEANRQIQEVTRAAVLSANDLQLIQVQEQYDALVDLANQYGLDTIDIEIARQRELARIQEEFEEENIQRAIEAQQERADANAKAFQTIANVVGAAIQATSDASKEATALQKVLTLAQIGFNAASAISAATARAVEGAPFPVNLVAIGTSITAVLAAIAQARQVFAETPQFFKGRWVNAKGADDGRTYKARYIGQPGTGYLPNHPTLLDTSIGTVLGSERGTEYFVSNKALRDPMVMNYVQAIDSIVRTRQFQNGGATNPAAMPGSSPADNSQLLAMTSNLTSVLGALTEVLAKGIVARYDDDEVINILEQMNKLQRASGGVL